MKQEEWFRQHAGKYRLVKIIIEENDCSQAYAKGWEDKSLYMVFEITGEGKLSLKAHTAAAEKEYTYFFDPTEMKYHLKEDRSDKGTPITIENGVLTEEAPDHLMEYVLTDELD